MGGHVRVFEWDAADEPPATTTTAPPATTTTEPNKCGDGRFEESENGRRYGGRIASFPRSRVGTIGACSVKCADTSGCLGIRWIPGKRRPCTTLKGSLNRRCGSSNVCCTQVGDFTLDSSD